MGFWFTDYCFPILLWNLTMQICQPSRRDESFSAINFVFYFTENTVKNALQIGDILQAYAVGDQSDEHINDFGVINNGGPRSGH